MERIKITQADRVFIRDSGETVGCGDLNGDGKLYFIDKEKGVAALLPEKYQRTQLVICPPCGGYNEGLIMVNLLGELKLQYHHNYYPAAGLWGWIDLDGNEVIPPQYVYAMKFDNGRAVVCKGDWSVDERDRYWCDNEQWGMIDRQGNEVVPCRFDEIEPIDGSERYVLCHEGGWENGQSVIYDIKTGSVIVELSFEFDAGYMFNQCWLERGKIFFDEHLPGEEKDLISVYSIRRKKWLRRREPVGGRKLNGETKVTVERDGEEIIVF